MAQVVVVDDHPIARMAVRYLLEQNGHTVLAESADGREAVTPDSAAAAGYRHH